MDTPSPICPPGVSIDFDRATITLAGTSFPAAIPVIGRDPLNCPIDGRNRCGNCPADLPHGGCSFGGKMILADTGWQEAWSLCVPGENGALFVIEYDTSKLGDEGLSLHTYSPNYDEPIRPRESWEPGGLTIAHVVGRTITDKVHRAPFMWRHCEPDWLAETILRMSRYTVDVHPGTPVALVSIGDERVRPVAAGS